MPARQSPPDYLAAALTTAMIRGVTSPLAALAAPAWARRRLQAADRHPLPWAQGGAVRVGVELRLWLGFGFGVWVWG